MFAREALREKRNQGKSLGKCVTRVTRWTCNRVTADDVRVRCTHASTFTRLAAAALSLLFIHPTPCTAVSLSASPTVQGPVPGPFLCLAGRKTLNQRGYAELKAYDTRHQALPSVRAGGFGVSREARVRFRVYRFE